MARRCAEQAKMYELSDGVHGHIAKGTLLRKNIGYPYVWGLQNFQQIVGKQAVLHTVHVCLFGLLL